VLHLEQSTYRHLGPRLLLLSHTQALISVFKSRIIDSRGRDTAIEKCEVSVQEQAQETECRFIIKMICSYGKINLLLRSEWQLNDMKGVTKTYKLTYESVEVMHALFDRNTANNRWSIKSAFLKEFIDYFSPKSEQLDIYAEDGKVTFLSFTEKVVNRKNGMSICDILRKTAYK
jgi:cell cycle checkpoint control protein RAD9A